MSISIHHTRPIKQDRSHKNLRHSVHYRSPSSRDVHVQKAANLLKADITALKYILETRDEPFLIEADNDSFEQMCPYHLFIDKTKGATELVVSLDRSQSSPTTRRALSQIGIAGEQMLAAADYFPFDTVMVG
jgi:hypothetical protein